jgi:hypothetical protein
MMTNEQIEQTLRIMYEEIKSLKNEVKDLKYAVKTFNELDLQNSISKRDYWSIDEHQSR